MAFFGIFVLLIIGLCVGIKIPNKQSEGLYGRHIIGGRNTTISEFPYIVSIEINGKFSCGGTIVSGSFILTAAHCVPFSSAKLRFNDSCCGPCLTVRVGSSYIQKNGVVHKVKRAVVHPKYYLVDYDVGVIELEKPIEFNENATAIEIQDEEPKDGEIATVVGFGSHNMKWELPPILQTVDIRVINENICRIFLEHLTPRSFCTYERGKTPFVGDSGGPVVVDGKVAGAVSWRSRCPTLTPVAYTKFMDEEIRDFIRQETGI